MIAQMLKDIRVFLIIFVFSIFAVANFYAIVDQATDKETVVGQSLIESIIYTYQQSLGELGTEDLNKNSNAWAFWLVFFVSSMLLQVTMLNLVIAIMGDTFDRVFDAQEENTTTQMLINISRNVKYINRPLAKQRILVYASTNHPDNASET